MLVVVNRGASCHGASDVADGQRIVDVGGRIGIVLVVWCHREGKRGKGGKQKGGKKTVEPLALFVVGLAAVAETLGNSSSGNRASSAMASTLESWSCEYTGWQGTTLDILRSTQVLILCYYQQYILSLCS